MKYLKKILLSLLTLFLCVGIVSAAYPAGSTNWVTGNVITSAWLNSIETLLGTSPNKGSVLVATSTTSGIWLPVGADGKVLTASSTATNGVSWETAVSSAANLYAPGFITATSSAFYNQGFITSTSTAFQTPITFPIPYASSTHMTILGSTYIGVSTSNGTSTITNNGVQSINNATGTLSGLNIYNTTTTINGLSGAISGLNIYNTTTTIQGLSGAITLAGNLKTVGNALNTTQDIAATSSPTFSNLTVTNTATSSESDITTLKFSDNTIFKTAFKDTGFNAINASTTTAANTSSTIQKIFYQPITINQIYCSTDGATITLQADKRSSSTPQTFGTLMLNAMSCTSTGNSSSTIASNTMTAGQILNFWPSSVPNSTTTLIVGFKYTENN